MGEKYHEIIQPAKELLRGLGGRLLSLVVPEEAVTWGGGPLLDEYVSGPRSVPPANPKTLD